MNTDFEGPQLRPSPLRHLGPAFAGFLLVGAGMTTALGIAIQNPKYGGYKGHPKGLQLMLMGAALYVFALAITYLQTAVRARLPKSSAVRWLLRLTVVGGVWYPLIFGGMFFGEFLNEQNPAAVFLALLTWAASVLPTFLVLGNRSRP